MDPRPVATRAGMIVKVAMTDDARAIAGDVIGLLLPDVDAVEDVAAWLERLAAELVAMVCP